MAGMQCTMEMLPGHAADLLHAILKRGKQEA